MDPSRPGALWTDDEKVREVNEAHAAGWRPNVAQSTACRVAESAFAHDNALSLHGAVFNGAPSVAQLLR